MSAPAPADTGETVDISIASAPCDISSVPRLIDDIASLGSAHDLSADRDARLSLLEKARSLVAALETPRETMLKHVGAETASFYSIAIGVDVGLFKEMAKNSGSPKKAPELAEALGFDIEVLRRILRHLTAMKHITQTNPDEYASNNFTLCLTHPLVADAYPCYRDIAIPPMLSFHKWLATKSYAAPTKTTDNPFTFGHQTSQSMFEYIAARPTLYTQFSHHMGGYRLGRPSWFSPSIYPVEERLLAGYDHSSALLVDVGGNLGHDLESFKGAFPSVEGQLVLQDTPAVIEVAPTDALRELGIDATAHDFFTPQPVEGARAYYLHHILHDWPDERCVDIVSQIKAVMKPGYSRLLVNEHVIPAMGPNWEVTYMDLYMMVMFGAMERTEEEWRALLEGKCGLRVVKVWNPGNGVEGIIECDVPVAS